MLRIEIGEEAWDQKAEKFTFLIQDVLELEHSLLSLSKWESKFKKSFIATEDKTSEEVIEYVKMMTLTPDVPDSTFRKLTQEHYDVIAAYISDAQTATFFAEDSSQGRSNQIITNELIYAWMAQMKVAKECETWHLNRLITLLRAISAQNNPKKGGKPTTDDLARRRELNRQRRAELGTSG